MIADKIENWERYFKGDAWKKAFEFLQTLEPDAEPGKYEIDGSKIFAIVSAYETKQLEDCKFEAHRDYVDIQVLLDGFEFIEWMPVDELETTVEYSAETDCEFFEYPDFFGGNSLLCPGLFAVYYPEDGHMPQICIEDPEPVRKCVIKIHRDEVA